jgi:hypothetical protein
VGDHDGRLVIFTYKEVEEDISSIVDQSEEREPLKAQVPQLQFFDEIFAFEMEFNIQKCIDIMPKITAIEWLNQNYEGYRPRFLVSSEKSIKLFDIKVREIEPFRANFDFSTSGFLPKNMSAQAYYNKE